MLQIHILTHDQPISYAQAVNNTPHQFLSKSTKTLNNNHGKIPNDSTDPIISEEMKQVRQQLLELKTTQQQLDQQHKTFEAKQLQSNNYMLEEIKRTNETINTDVMTNIEKTHHEISDIKKEMFTLKELNSNVNAVLQFVTQYIRNDAQKKQTTTYINDDMMIDKEGNKRNFNGKLRDDNGNVPTHNNNKENTSTGGNHNNCNTHMTDLIVNCNP
jgi:hypothetical protein